MPLEPGTNLGQYEVLARLGAGGMGEVYRARDLALGREVALKVLPETVNPASFRLGDDDSGLRGGASDQRLTELRAEARMLASLNHPNVATLYGFETEADVSYLVMEMVEGRTLADRLRQGPLPVREALRVFIQIADGLEEAHQRGIAHCDLKPQNVMITPQGGVKILDFGVARVLDTPGKHGRRDPDQSTTLTQPSSDSGAATGTLPYLSPEQARGLRGDTSADVWAFGCCLFEALTGRRVFQGGTASDTLVKILDREPDWRKLPEGTPPRIRHLLRRCLEKELSGRLRHIGDAGLELRDALEEETHPPVEAAAASPPPTAASRRVGVAGLLTAAAAALVLGAGAVLLLRPATTAPDQRPLRRLSLNLPVDHPLQPSLPISPHRGMALSRDGRLLIYVGQSGETTQLFKRSLDDLVTEPIAGTEGAWYPFFSPDERWVGFFDREARTLEKVSLGGGLPEVLATLPPGVAATTGGLGASWGEDGTIVYSPVARDGLLRVPENGGTPEVVSALAPGELYRGFPSHLPGDRGLLVMYGTGLSAASRKVGHVDLRTGELKPLVEPGGMPRWVPSGHLVFSQGGELMAAPFDLERLELAGPPVKVTEPRMRQGVVEPSEWDVAGDGTLLYATAGAGGASGREAALVDAEGDGTVLAMNAVADSDWARLSPDGSRVVYGSVDAAGNWDIYLHVPADGSNRRLTFDPSFESRPVFAPDGRWVLFTSADGPVRRIAELDPGRGSPRYLSDENLGFPRSLSPDGDLVFFDRAENDVTREDIGYVSRRTGIATMLLQTAASERYPAISPDGHWLAYESNATGRAELYVQPFPAFDATYQVSSEGGRFPVWSAAGDLLYFRQGRALVSVAIDSEEGFAAGPPQLLFESPFDVENDFFDVSPDGQHFLVLRPSVGGVSELVVVEGWLEELERLAPVE